MTFKVSYPGAVTWNKLFIDTQQRHTYTYIHNESFFKMIEAIYFDTFSFYFWNSSQDSLNWFCKPSTYYNPLFETKMYKCTFTKLEIRDCKRKKDADSMSKYWSYRRFESWWVVHSKASHHGIPKKESRVPGASTQA